MAISLLQETSVATPRLPRFARNDISTETGYASAAKPVDAIGCDAIIVYRKSMQQRWYAHVWA